MAALINHLLTYLHGPETGTKTLKYGYGKTQDNQLLC